MKKLFSILMVLVVISATVFATDSAPETHAIRMKTVVEAELPKFQLKFFEQAIPTTAVGDEDLSLLTVTDSTTNINTNVSALSWEAGESYDYASEIRVADVSQHDIDVTFGAILANSSRRIQARKYTITFTAGDFTVTRNKVENQTHSATTYEVTDKLSGVDYVRVSDLDTSLATSDAVTVQFLGLHQDNIEDGATLAKFHAVYPQDKSIDPDPAGYEGTVTMTVVAEY